MSKMRDEIAELVYVYANRRESGFAYPTDQMVANEILDLVREALLSGPAIQAGSIAVLDDESAACWECINEANKTTRPILRAALDAVIGKGGER